MEKDEAYAAQCFEKDLPFGTMRAYAYLGWQSFYGRGVPQDYNRAFELLSYAYQQGNTGNFYLLGKSYFSGLGTSKDYKKAREFLEKVDPADSDTLYMLGYIYGRGLGVTEDIQKAVTLLKKATKSPEAKEELLHYKKSLFGKWSRR